MLTTAHFHLKMLMRTTHDTHPDWVPIPYSSLDVVQVEDVDGREVERGAFVITGELEHFLQLRGEIDMIIAELSRVEPDWTGPAVSVGS